MSAKRCAHCERARASASVGAFAMLLYMGGARGVRRAAGRWRDGGTRTRGTLWEHERCRSVKAYEPLKTEHPRKMPVHPEFERCIEGWWNEGLRGLKKHPPYCVSRCVTI
jgi:hypothetical protein